VPRDKAAADRALTGLKVELTSALNVLDHALKCDSLQEKDAAIFLVRSDLRRLVVSDSIEP